MEHVQCMTGALITKQTELRKHLEEIQGVIRQIEEQITYGLNRNSSLQQGPNEEIQQQLREKNLLLSKVLEAVKSTETKLGQGICTITDLTLNTKQLEQQVQDLKNELAESLNNNATLQRVLKDLKDKTDQKREETQAEREADSRHKEELSEQIQTLQSRVETLDRENSVLRREQKEELLTKIHNLESRVAELEEEKSDVVREADAARCCKDEAQRELNEKVRSLNVVLRTLASTNEQLARKTSTNQDLNEQLRQLNEQHQALLARADDCHKKNTTLTTRAVLWRAAARAGFRDLGVSRQNQERMKSDLDQRQSNNTTLQRALKDLRDQAERHREETHAQRETDNKHKEELSEQIQTLQSSAETLDRENFVLLREKEQMEDELLELRQYSTNYQVAMATFANETAQLRQTSQDVCGQLHLLEAQKTESDNNVARLRQEKEILREQVVQAMTESQELRGQANSQVTYINNLTVAFQAMQRQMMTLQADDDRCRHEAQRLEAQLQETRDLVWSRDEDIAALREEILRRDADLEAARTRQRDLESVLRARSVHVWRYQTEVEEGRKTIRILEEEMKLQSFRDKSANNMSK